MLELKSGFLAAELPEGKLIRCTLNGDPVLLIKEGSQIRAVGGKCSHYGAELGEGLCTGQTVVCPWHHARFDLTTGKAIQAPAFTPLPVWRVVEREGRCFLESSPPLAVAPSKDSSTSKMKVLIIGGGAAGNSAAETLRTEGFAGTVTLVTEEDALPYDRPNLSKDYLAGTATEDWIPLHDSTFYEKNNIQILKDTRVTAVDPVKKTAQLGSGESLDYDFCLLATGARANTLEVHGSHLPHVVTLRSYEDCRTILDKVHHSERVVVVGASFIGLEVAASLRTRGLKVDVVTPESQPMDRILGSRVGEMIQQIHEERGVRFHFESMLTRIDPDRVTLTDGSELPADLIVAGIGVKPRLELAQQMGLNVESGVWVNEYLETSMKDIYAAGDIAEYPDPRTGERRRVEHWVMAQRQGQVAALNMLGRKKKFEVVPFFWSQHYDLRLNYVGATRKWDRLEIQGSLSDRKFAGFYWENENIVAVLTLGRDALSLEAERALENNDQTVLRSLIQRQRKLPLRVEPGQLDHWMLKG